MLRNLGKYEEARELLATQILNHDKYATLFLPV